MIASMVLRFGVLAVVALAAIVSWINQRCANQNPPPQHWRNVNSKVRAFFVAHHYWLQSTLVLLLLGFILFVTGRNGLILGPDTAARFEVAGQVLDGTALRDATSDRPPLFPVVIATTYVLLRTSFEKSAQLVNAFFFVANLWLISRIVLKSTRSIFLAYMGLLAAFFSGHFRLLHVQSGEEPMHLFMMFCSLLFVMRFMRNHKLRELFLAAFLAAASPLAKTAGVLTPIAFCVVLIYLFMHKGINLKELLVLASSSVSLLALWQVRHWLVGEPPHYESIILADAFSRISLVAQDVASILAYYTISIELGSMLPTTAYIAFAVVVLLAMSKLSGKRLLGDLVAGNVYHFTHFIGLIILTVISPNSPLRHSAAAFASIILLVFLTLHRFFPGTMLHSEGRLRCL